MFAGVTNEVRSFTLNGVTVRTDQWVRGDQLPREWIKPFGVKADAALASATEAYKNELVNYQGANLRNVQTHPDKVYAQVIVGGEVVATIFERGCVELPRSIPGLNLGKASTAAFPEQAMTQEISQFLAGKGAKVIYSGFHETSGSKSAAALGKPASLGVAERRLNDLLDAYYRDAIAGGTESFVQGFSSESDFVSFYKSLYCEVPASERFA